jgi:hypothetical protein
MKENAPNADQHNDGERFLPDSDFCKSLPINKRHIATMETESLHESIKMGKEPPKNDPVLGTRPPKYKIVERT